MTAFHSDSGLAAVVQIAEIYELAVEPAQLAHGFGKAGEALSENDMLRALGSLGLKAAAGDTTPERLAQTPLPAIVRDKDGDYFILARIMNNGEQVLIKNSNEPLPVTIDVSAFKERWDGHIILVTRRASPEKDAAAFDLTWFVPAVVKYRKLFGEVLTSSLFLQLFGLITPLLFQVIIDKVLTHRSLATLDVLVIALIACSLFEVLLGGLRTYVFSHTTQRIDVMLGARLFKHLLALPMAYFGARRVGDTVARVRELENIRNFLTGSALTLIMDLAFTVVFFGVMFYFAPILSWIVVASIPFYVGLSLAVTPVLQARIEEKFQRGAAIVDDVQLEALAWIAA